MSEPIRHLYVHIPFCARICPYCAFYKTLPDRQIADAFCAALLREIDLLKNEFTIAPETIYFGGGTPTALNTRQLESLLAGFHHRLDLSSLREWTMEANPGSVSLRKASALRRLGVTRISLGVQSWNERLLSLLGREHNAAQAVASYDILRAADFPSINIDLMFALPTQSLGEWIETLERTVSLHPAHISTYCLTYEEDTDFFRRRGRGEFVPNEEIDARFFSATMQLLAHAGFEHYETSNYARAGHRSLHNQAYWRGADYIGIGPSAFSTAGLKRWQNAGDYRAYTAQLLAGPGPQRAFESLSDETKRGERTALSLRTADGIPKEWAATNSEARDEFLALGLWKEIGERLVLTDRGKLLADSVAEAFV